MPALTLTEVLRRVGALSEAAPVPAPLPVRLAGGRVVQPVPGTPDFGMAQSALPAPAQGQKTVRVLGGGGRRVVPPSPRAPGGIPAPASSPAIPPAPQAPEPRHGAEAAARRPPRVAVVPPNAFADTWSAKPSGPIEIGIRLISDADLDRARAYASKIAWGDHPNPNDVEGRTETYNEKLMQWAVATATCKPNNAQKTYWDGAYDVVPMALTDDGLKLLFHELMVLKIEMSPLIPEATAESIASLGKMLEIAAVADIIAARGEPRLRRHLTWIFDEVKKLVGVLPDHSTGPETDAVHPDAIPTGPIVG